MQQKRRFAPRSPTHQPGFVELLFVGVLSFLFFSGFLFSDAYSTTIEVGPDKRNVEWSSQLQDNHLKIDPKEGIADVEKAFRILREADPDANVFVIAGGVSINHVIDLQIMPNSTLVIVKHSFGNKEQSRVFRVEDISELGQR